MRVLVFVPPIRHPRASANRVYLRPLRLFLDLRKIFRWISQSISQSIPQLSIHHVSTTVIYDSRANSLRFFPELSSFSPSLLRGSLYLTPYTSHDSTLSPLVGSTRQRKSARTVAHSTCTPRGTQVYTHTKICTHIYIHRHRYTSGHATDGLTARMTRCALQRRPATQRRRCMHLPKAVRDEGGVGGGGGDGGGALYRVENARTGFGPVAPTNRYSGLR